MLGVLEIISVDSKRTDKERANERERGFGIGRAVSNERGRQMCERETRKGRGVSNGDG